MENEGRPILDTAGGTPADEQVSRLLGGLKRVEAPGDFDFRVRARIAAGRPQRSTASWLPSWVRLAAPLMLLLVVGGYFGLNLFYSSNKGGTRPVAEISPAGLVPAIGESPAVVAAAPPQNEVTSANPFVIKTPATVDRLVPRTLAARNASSRQPVVSPGAGSIDEALRNGVEIYPKGIDPNRKPSANGPDFDRSTSLPAKDVLSAIGVEATYSGSSWTVGGVRQNSPAERSGLKAGDVIETVNDRALAGMTAFAGRFILKSVRVRRDGKSVQIALKH